ncbi:hypothetical protein [Salinisphaera sp. C84B14]|uniref:hypothetical protein n=1 Tax=Salinisphaera sp. C84B14 TaxID=1304155 RepID=UPI00333EDECD
MGVFTAALRRAGLASSLGEQIVVYGELFPIPEKTLNKSKYGFKKLPARRPRLANAAVVARSQGTHARRKRPADNACLRQRLGLPVAKQCTQLNSDRGFFFG